MSELENVKLRPEGKEEPGAGTKGPKKGGGGGWLALLALILLVIVAGLYYFVFRGARKPQPAAPPAPTTVEAPQPSEAPEEPEVEPIELPELSASDELVRRLVGELSSHPQLAVWLASDELIRKFVASVDNIAEGTSPRPHLFHMVPKRSFPVIERGEEIVLDPAGYDRYDPATAVFISLDPQGTVRLYRQLEPLIRQAYRDLGYPDADFDDTLTRAIFRLLETPVAEGNLRLLPKVMTYEFADTRLEALSPAQKDLIRMGPDNERLIQVQLRTLARELGIPEQSLPRTPVWRAREAR